MKKRAKLGDIRYEGLKNQYVRQRITHTHVADACFRHGFVHMQVLNETPEHNSIAVHHVHYWKSNNQFVHHISEQIPHKT